jgi:hypothetical protein
MYKIHYLRRYIQVTWEKITRNQTLWEETDVISSVKRESRDGVAIGYWTGRRKECGALVIKKLNSVALIRERTMPTERPPLVGKVVPTFADRGCRVVSATDSHGR